MFQLVSSYGMVVADRKHTPLENRSCFPALALELCGNCIRVHALYWVGKACSQPLTPMLHLSDLRCSVPGYTESLARALKALVLTLDRLIDFYKPSDSDVPQRSPSLPDRLGLPYVLAGYSSCTKLPSSSVTEIYLCTDKGQADQKQVVKILARDYPEDLHKQLQVLQAAPPLLSCAQLPGGFTVVRYEYLDPSVGWQCLADLDSLVDLTENEMDALGEAYRGAVQKLHTCLGGKAVHGDLRANNVLIRRLGPGQFEVRLIDLDWGGESGKARYPAFLNHRNQWALQDPTEEFIMQEHDNVMMERTIAKLMGGHGSITGQGKVSHRSPPAGATPAAFGGLLSGGRSPLLDRGSAHLSQAASRFSFLPSQPPLQSRPLSRCPS